MKRWMMWGLALGIVGTFVHTTLAEEPANSEATAAPEVALTDSTAGSQDLSLAIAMLVKQDIQQMFEETEHRLLLQRLANHDATTPAWIPKYSTPPRMNPLDESNTLNANLFEWGDQGPKLFNEPNGYPLRTWEQTPQSAKDRDEVRQNAPVPK